MLRAYMFMYALNDFFLFEDPFSLIQIDNRWKAFIKQFE